MTSYSMRRGTYASPEVTRGVDSASPDGVTSSVSEDERIVRALVGHTGSIRGACVLVDYVITWSADCTVRFWRQSDGSPGGVLQTKEAITSLAHVPVSGGEHLLLIGCCQGDVELFRGTLDQPIKMRNVGRYPFHAPNPVTSLSVSRDRRLIASATCFRCYILEYRILTQSTRGGVKLWNVTDILDYANDDVIGSSSGAGSVSGQPVGRVMRTARQLGAEAARLLRISGSSLDRRVEDFGVSDVSFSPDATLLVVGFGFGQHTVTTWSKTIVFCDVINLNVLHVYRGVTSEVRHVEAITAFSLQPDDDDGDVMGPCYVFVQTPSGVIKLKVGKRKDDPREINTSVGWVYSDSEKNRICTGIAISPDNRTIVSAHASADVIRSRQRYTNPTLVFHDVSTGHVLASYDVGTEGKISPCCFNGTGSVLYAAADDRTLKCFRSPRRHVFSPMNKGYFQTGNDAKNPTTGTRLIGDTRNTNPALTVPITEPDVCSAHALPSPEIRQKRLSFNSLDSFGSQIGHRPSIENLWNDDVDGN